ncbi:MAG: hypothetical protein V4760_04770 [Bdellovibrionota bacterium]
MKRNLGRDSNTEIRIVVVLAAISILALVVFGTKSRRERPAPEPTVLEETASEVQTSSAHAHESPSHVASVAAVAPPATSKSARPDAFAAVTPEERASLNTLTSLLFQETRGSTQPNELVSRLSQLGYKPLVSRDSNEFTGSMVIVRTQNALPGTRYFHAQYFTDETGRYYPQYVSFEFRPSQTMDEVVRSLESSFGRLGRPTTNDGIWMTWKLPDDYTLWIKRIEKQDLAGDPFNAYSAQDVNTLKVAIEKDVPGHEDEEHL